MKRTFTVFFLGVIYLLLMPATGNVIAQPQGIGQGQVSGSAGTNPGTTQDAAAQVRRLSDQIKAVQEERNDAHRELGQLLDDLKRLRASRPSPPKGTNPEEKDAYKKSVSDWQYKVTAKEHEVYVAHATLDRLEQRLKYLEQELAGLQGKAGDGSGK